MFCSKLTKIKSNLFIISTQERRCCFTTKGNIYRYRRKLFENIGISGKNVYRASLVSIAFLKGQFTQKWKICHLYSASSSSSPVWMCLFCWTQRKIFWRKFVSGLFWGTIDFHSRKNKILVPQNCSVSHILQNIFLCVHPNKFGWTVSLRPPAS